MPWSLPMVFKMCAGIVSEDYLDLDLHMSESDNESVSESLQKDILNPYNLVPINSGIVVRDKTLSEKKNAVECSHDTVMDVDADDLSTITQTKSPDKESRQSVLQSINFNPENPFPINTSLVPRVTILSEEQQGINRNPENPFSINNSLLVRDTTSSEEQNAVSQGSHSLPNSTNLKTKLEDDVGKKKVCACLLCGHHLIAFPRHLREYHKFSHEAAKIFANKFKRSGAALKDVPVHTLKKYTCPVEGCESVVNRIDRHLIGKKHKFEIGKKEYLQHKLLAKCHNVPAVVNSSLIDCDTDSSLSSQSEDDDFDCDDGDDNNTDLCPLQSEDNSDDLDSVSPEDDLKMTEGFGEMGEVILGDLEHYCNRLKDFAGVYKSESEVRQIRQHVIDVLKHFGTDFKAESLCENLISVENDFISTKLKTLQASTIKNYLLDFKRFVSWAKVWNKSWITWQAADRIEILVTSWNKSLRVLIGRRSNEKKLEHRRCALTEDDFAAYFDGEKAITANNIFLASGNKEDGEQSYLNTKEHTCARNFLLMLLTVSNASRAGPLINMTLKDVDNAEYDEETGRNVISVVKQKTQLTYGAAQLSLDKESFGYLLIYIYKIRSLVKGAKDLDHVFITSKCRPINQSELANILTKEMLHVVGRKKRTTCTLIRKSIVSIMLKGDMGAGNETDLAALMKHSEWMQKNVYDVRRSDTNMARMGGLVFKVVTKKSVSQKDLQRPGGFCKPALSTYVHVDNPDKLSKVTLTPKGGTGSSVIQLPGLSVDNSNINELSTQMSGTHISLLAAHTRSQNRPTMKTKNVSTKLNSKTKGPIRVRNVSLLAAHTRSHNRPTMKTTVSTKLKKWPIHLKNRVGELFRSNISKGHVTSSEVKLLLNRETDLMKQIMKHTKSTSLVHNVKKIYDLVRSFYRSKT